MENIITADNAEVKIFKSIRELHKNASGYICASIRHFINRRGICTFVLSGGNTPKKLFDEISTGFRDSIQWNKVFFFWGDERCVPPDNNESNYKMAQEHLLSKLPVLKENIIRIKGEKLPEEAADIYEAEIREFFGHTPLPSFDIILLGIGTDGHTASLFPGTKALNTEDRIAAAVYSEKLKSWRVTLTLPVINNSKNILVIAEGKEKSETVSLIFNDKNAGIPAQKVNALNGKLTWFLDDAAAGKAFEGITN